MLHGVDKSAHPIADFLGLVAFELDEHGRFRLRGNEQVEANFAFTHQAQVATIHQVAGRRAPGQ